MNLFHDKQKKNKENQQMKTTNNIHTGYENKPRAPFKSQYIQQYVLKSHQVWCQIKAWVLNFLGMSLDMKIRLKLSEICKET